MAPPLTLELDPDAVFELLLTADAQVRRTLADATASGSDVEAARADTATLAEAVRTVGAALAAAGFHPSPDQLTRVPTTTVPASDVMPQRVPPSSGAAIRGARIQTGPTSVGIPGFPR